MRKWLRPLFIFFLTMALLVIGSGLLIAWYYEDEVKRVAVERINGILETEVFVDKIEFSLLTKFPKAAIEFKNIQVREKSLKESDNNILEASSLFLEFNPFDLLTGNYTIDVIQMEKGTLNIIQFKNGVDNYGFFSKSQGDKTFELLLEKVKVKNSQLRYTNERNNLSFNSTLESLELSGDFQSDEFKLKFKTSGKLKGFNSSSFNFSGVHDIKINMTLSINQTNQQYDIDNGQLKLDDLSLNLSGLIAVQNEAAEYDLNFKSEKAKFKDIQALLTPKMNERLTPYNMRGDLNINGEVKGISSKTSSPELAFNFEVIEGEVSYPGGKFKANDVALKGSFTNGESHGLKTSKLEVDTFSFMGNIGLNQGKLLLENFENPHLTLSTNLRIDLKALKEMINNDSIEVLEGEVIMNLKTRGSLEDISEFKAIDIKSAKMIGNLELNDVSFTTSGMPHGLAKANGTAQFGQNQLNVDSLTFSVADVPFKFEGSLHNLIPFLFYENETLIGRAKLHCTDLNLDQLIKVSDEKDDPEAEVPILISDNVIMDLELFADKVSYRKFKAENFKGGVSSEYPTLLIENASFSGMEGEIGGWLQFTAIENNNTEMTSELKLQHVNIRELFTQFENFGQKAIDANHLEGYADVEMEFKSILNLNLDFDLDKTFVRGKVDVRNGQLINYQPALALSKYVDVDELEHIKFSRLSNEIEIKNRTVIIPEMEIKSSALELKLSGTHSFKNEIEYHFQLWLNDFLFRKAKRKKKNKSEFGDIEQDETGRAKLYIRMTGTVDDYKISLDRKALREKWNDNLQEERSELKQLFKEEFSKEKKNKPAAPANFEVEWQEEGFKKKEPIKEEKSEVQQRLEEEDKKKKKKKFFGKDLEDELEEYDPEKFD